MKQKNAILIRFVYDESEHIVLFYSIFSRIK
jgi:hypothetical protein